MKELRRVPLGDADADVEPTDELVQAVEVLVKEKCRWSCEKLELLS